MKNYVHLLWKFVILPSIQQFLSSHDYIKVMSNNAAHMFMVLSSKSVGVSFDFNSLDDALFSVFTEFLFKYHLE